MSTAVRYTAAKRRAVEAERAAALEAKLAGYAAMSLEDYVAEMLEQAPPAAHCQAETRTFAIARHAELVKLYR